jgi:hypothetical protein
MKRIESKSYFDLKKFADDMGKATPIPFTGIPKTPAPTPVRRPSVPKDPIQQLVYQADLSHLVGKFTVMGERTTRSGSLNVDIWGVYPSLQAAKKLHPLDRPEDPNEYKDQYVQITPDFIAKHEREIRSAISEEVASIDRGEFLNGGSILNYFPEIKMKASNKRKDIDRKEESYGPRASPPKNPNLD